MSITDQILTTPIAVSLLAIILAAGALYVRGIGPRQAIHYDRVRRLVWRALDPIFRRRGRPLTRDATGKDQHVATVDVSLLELAKALWQGGFRWNPFSTTKYRIVDGETQWAVLPVVYRESVVADDQYDYYIFPTIGRGKWAIWGHREANITDPADHHGGDEQTSAGVEAVLQEALGEAGVA